MNRRVHGVVLLLVPELLDRLLLQIELAQAGYAVGDVPDCVAAMERLRLHHVDAIITELREPFMESLQFVRHIKSIAPRTHVLVMTASDSIELAVEVMKAGACDLVTGPLTPGLVRERLERLQSSPEWTARADATGDTVSTERSADRSPLAWFDPSASLGAIVAQVEQGLIDAALRRAAGNQHKAAAALGIPRGTLRDKMAKYGFLPKHAVPRES